MSGPTGGYIIGRRSIAEVYSTGKGIIRVRGKAEIKPGKEKRQNIIITEMPYQVNKAEFIKAVADLARDKKLEGIADIADRSDRDGMHVEIVLKKDANADVVLCAGLYASRPCVEAAGNRARKAVG